MGSNEDIEDLGGGNCNAKIPKSVCAESHIGHILDGIGYKQLQRTPIVTYLILLGHKCRCG